MNDEEKKASAQKRLMEKITELKDEVIDCVLKAIPPEVAEHLGNSKKELLKALRAMIDKEIEAIDKTIDRARKLHKE